MGANLMESAVFIVHNFIQHKRIIFKQEKSMFDKLGYTINWQNLKRTEQLIRRAKQAETRQPD